MARKVFASGKVESIGGIKVMTITFASGDTVVKASRTIDAKRFGHKK